MTTADTMRAIQTRHEWDDETMAAYLGVPAPTWRNWRNGARKPPKIAARLIEVLGTVEALAPALHAALMPPDAP